MKYIFIDTFAIANLTKDKLTEEKLIAYIKNNNLVLAINIVQLIEIYKWKSSWENILGFISSVHFVVSKNPDKILEDEVINYPNDIELPYSLDSVDLSESKTIIKDAIEINMHEKIGNYEKDFRDYIKKLFEEIKSEKEKFPPESNGKYTLFQMWLFVEFNLLNQLYVNHKQFVDLYYEKERIIESHFKSVNIVSLAIYFEYYLQNKKGKESDIGDFWHLSYLPYCHIAIIDNERFNLICRINTDTKIKENFTKQNTDLSIKCKTYNLKSFLEVLK